MKRVIQVLWFTIRAVYDEMFALSGMGLIWFLTAAVVPGGLFALASMISPIAGLISLLLSLLILAPLVTGGLYSVTVEIARERRIEFGYFWQGLKSYARLGWTMGAIVLASGVVLVFDVYFYFTQENMVFPVIGFLGLWALLFWITVQIYLFPLVTMQEDKRIKVILKNASLLTLAFPLFALGIVVITALVTALSVLLVFILLATLWMPFIAILNSRATLSSLQQVEGIKQRQEELAQESEDE